MADVDVYLIEAYLLEVQAPLADAEYRTSYTAEYDSTDGFIKNRTTFDLKVGKNMSDPYVVCRTNGGLVAAVPCGRPLIPNDVVQFPPGHLVIDGGLRHWLAVQMHAPAVFGDPQGHKLPSPKLPAQASQEKVGFNCSSCNQRNDHATANQKDGTYVCFNCRQP